MSRVRSLRSRLFRLIVVPLVAVAALAAVARYVVAERMSERLYDNTLLTVALAISRDVVLSEGDVLAEVLLDSLTRALGDPIYYMVTGPDGRFVTGYTDPPRPPEDRDVAPGVPTFYDATYLGDPVRVVALREFISEPQFGGWVTVQVWQTVGQREALSLELAMQAAMLMAAIILAAGGFVWFGINFGLKPLLQLRAAVERRSPADLTPIRRPVPREVTSLVEAMNTLFGRLASAFAERDQLIANAAHQLRNPIAGLQAQAEAAATAPTEAELRNRAQGVAEAARRTSRLTTQLLSMEKVRGRAARARNTDVDLAALAAEVTRAHAPSALRRKASLSLDIEGTPAPIRGDPVLLAEALDNLIDNALRYGCRDGGTIRVRVVFESDRARLIVEDDGPGVPADQRERVFERFHRGVEDGSDGCGLGLAIAWGIAERHGGAIRLADSPRGARFELELPSATAAGDRPRPVHIT